MLTGGGGQRLWGGEGVYDCAGFLILIGGYWRSLHLFMVVWWLQVRIINLQGKNYIFTLAPTFYPLAEAGCTAAASKTRKNIIVTLQVGLPFRGNQSIAGLICCPACSCHSNGAGHASFPKYEHHVLATAEARNTLCGSAWIL